MSKYQWPNKRRRQAGYKAIHAGVKREINGISDYALKELGLHNLRNPRRVRRDM